MVDMCMLNMDRMRQEHISHLIRNINERNTSGKQARIEVTATLW